VKSFALTALAVLFSAVSLLAQHEVTATEIEEGGQLFLANCATCHGPEGDAVFSVDLGHGDFRRAESDEDLVRIIRTGIAGTAMPPGSYSELQAGTIVA
jgi:mono/diheme cytochrome c family protein